MPFWFHKQVNWGIAVMTCLKLHHFNASIIGASQELWLAVVWYELWEHTASINPDQLNCSHTSLQLCTTNVSLALSYNGCWHLYFISYLSSKYLFQKVQISKATSWIPFYSLKFSPYFFPLSFHPALQNPITLTLQWAKHTWKFFPFLLICFISDILQIKCT